MKRCSIIAILFLAIASIISLYHHAGTSTASGKRVVTILHFNDLHGAATPDDDNKGGLARLASAISQVRSNSSNTILLVSGDMIGGSILSSLTKGEAMFRLSNMLKIDAFVPGNHEFDYGMKPYYKFMDVASFPFLAANMSETSGGRPVKDAGYLVLDIGGVKVGVIGFTHPAMKYLTLPRNTEGIDFTEPGKIARNLIREVDGKSDLVVALTHLGLDDDKILAKKVKGLDLIIGGHTHDFLFKPEKANGSFIFQAGRDGRALGVIDVTLDGASEKIISVKGKLIAIGQNIPEDPQMLAAVKSEEAALPIKPDTVIGNAPDRVDAYDDIAPWIAGILKRRMNADIGFVNNGGVRSGLEPGPITYRDLFRIMPFDNMIVSARISGTKLQKWLDDEDLIPDTRIEVDPERIYNVALPDFVALMRHISASDMKVSDIMVRDAMAEEIRAGRAPRLRR